MAKKKIFILGSTGMAGHMIYYFLENTSKYKIVNLSYRRKLNDRSILCDVRDIEKLKGIISEVKPQVIINSIGALIRQSNVDPVGTIYLNSLLPHILYNLSSDNGYKLIQISTDCVFSGNNGPYSEDDFRDADDLYGRSKALGEIESGNAITIRTSIIGPEIKNNGEGLFHWFMNQRGEVKGYKNALWGGVTTLELAKAIDKAIGQDICGLYHLTNGIPISKLDLLCMIKSVWGKNDVVINPFENKSVDKSLRPSIRFDFEVPGYEAMLIELKKEMKVIGNYLY